MGPVVVRTKERMIMAGRQFEVFDDGNFETEVLNREELTVVDFWAEWCVPCKQMSRLLEEIAGEIPGGVRIGTVNADENPALVERYVVRAVPALLFFKDGKLVEARSGVDRKQVIRKAIEAHA